ncbi:MAG: sugar ABC transporter permease [Actinobacteria bacterium]|nr:sugar ABC transporter permease [Actinomycetota bacterium]
MKVQEIKSQKISFVTRFEKLRIYPYVWLIPIFIIIATFYIYPIIFSTGLSLFKWDGYKPLTQIVFIGLKNYKDMIGDSLFWMSLRNTIFFVMGTLIFQNLFGMTLAVVLFYSNMKLSKLWRSIIFFPAIISPVIVALVWRLIFTKGGLIGLLLSTVGLSKLSQTLWLANPYTPIWVITWVNIWQWTGYNMVIYYAGLQTIPEEVIEAAKIDGANWGKIFSKVIVPLLSGAISIAMVLNIIGGFKVFDLVFTLTRGGPAHHSEVLTSYMFFNSFVPFGPNKMGYASALSVVLTILVFVAAYIRIRLTRQVER